MPEFNEPTNGHGNGAAPPTGNGVHNASDGNGAGTPKPDWLRQYEAVLNSGAPYAWLQRGAALQNLIDGGTRDLEQECHYPQGGVNTIPPDFYRELFDREAIANRVVQALPNETWQTAPRVFETEDPSELTEFEQAVDDLGKQMAGGSSWLQTDTGGPIWEYLRRVDVLSGIGHFGVLLLGIDDGRNLQDPVEGVEVVVNTQVRGPDGMVHNCKAVLPDSPMHENDLAYARATSPPKEIANKLFSGQAFGGKEDWTREERWLDATANSCWWDQDSEALIYSEAGKVVVNRMTGAVNPQSLPVVNSYLASNANPEGCNQYKPCDDDEHESVAESGRKAEAAVARREGAFHEALNGLSKGTVIKSGKNTFTKEMVGDETFWKWEGAKGKYKGHLASVQAFREMGSKSAIQAIGKDPTDNTYFDFTANATAKSPDDFYKGGAPPPSSYIGTPQSGKGGKGTEGQYSWGQGLGMAMPAGAALSGTDQQYFGVQFGPSEQLPPEPPKMKEGERPRLLFLRCFSEDLVQVVRYEWNIRNPRFGLPVMYRIVLNDPREVHSGIGLPLATVYVHWSRVIHVADNLMSSEIFGVPRMRPCLNRLLDLRKMYAADGEGVWKSCFDGDTKFFDGHTLRELQDCVGETVLVTCADGVQREATVESFGVRKLVRVELAPALDSPSHRTKFRRFVTATPDHRWLLANGTVTTSLKPGDVLVSNRFSERGELPYDAAGFAHGVVFGDGNMRTGRSHYFEVKLHGKKEHLFDALKETAHIARPRGWRKDGKPYLIFVNYEVNMKELPAPGKHSEAYINSFLNGWLATDGYDCQTQNGLMGLSSSKPDAIEWFLANAPYYGYQIAGYTVYTEPTNKGERNYPLYMMRYRRGMQGYMVKSIADEGQEEETYCVVEPVTKSFTLEGGIVTGNCFSGLSLETNPQLGGDVVIDQVGLRTMVADYQNQLQRALFLSGMTAKTIPPQVISVKEHIDVQLEAVAIQLAMPVRVLKGSERGELASSQDDAKWNDRLKHRQHMHVTPRIIVLFFDRLIQIGVLPAPVGKIIEKDAKPTGQKSTATPKEGDDEQQGDKQGGTKFQEGKDQAGTPTGTSKAVPNRGGYTTPGGGPTKPPSKPGQFGKPKSPSMNRRRVGRGYVVTYNRLVTMEVWNAAANDGEGAVEEKTQSKKVTVYEADGGYSIEWPELDSNTGKDKAAIAAQLTAAIAQYVQAGAEAVLPAEIFFVQVMKWDEELVREIMDQVHSAAAPPLTMPPPGEEGHPATPPKPPAIFGPDGKPVEGAEGTGGKPFQLKPPPDAAAAKDAGKFKSAQKAAAGPTGNEWVANADFDEDAHPRDDKGRFGSGGGSPGKAASVPDKSAPGGFAQALRDATLAKASEVEFSDEVVEPQDAVSSSDDDEIERQMTSEEQLEMSASLDEQRSSSIEDYIDQDEGEHGVSSSDLAENAGYSTREVCDGVRDLIKEHHGGTEEEQTAAQTAVDDYEESHQYGDGGTDAVDQLEGALRHGEHMTDSLASAMDSYREEVDKAIQKEDEHARDQYQESLRDQLESEYDGSADRQQYLRQFYNDHEDEDRFAGTSPDIRQNTWVKDRDGNDMYQFETSTGNRYDVTAFQGHMGNLSMMKEFGLTKPPVDIQFSDAAGSFRVTGAGSAREVFSNVTIATVAYALHNDQPVMTFSAAEPSRRKLYDKLVKSVAAVLPGYSAIAADGPHARQYAVVKRELRDKAIAMVDAPGRGMSKPTILVNEMQADWWPREFVTNALRVHNANPEGCNQYRPCGESGGSEPGKPGQRTLHLKGDVVEVSINPSRQGLDNWTRGPNPPQLRGMVSDDGDALVWEDHSESGKDIYHHEVAVAMGLVVPSVGERFRVERRQGAEHAEVKLYEEPKYSQAILSWARKSGITANYDATLNFREDQSRDEHGRFSSGAAEATGLARKARGGGFTYRPIGSSSPHEGFVVSLPRTQGWEKQLSVEEFKQHGRAQLRQYLEKVRDAVQAGDLDAKHTHVGAWVDEKTNRVVLDVNEVYKSKGEAIHVGQRRQQDAIFDLKTFSEIDLRKQGERTRAPTGNAGRQGHGGPHHGQGDGRRPGAAGGYDVSGVTLTTTHNAEELTGGKWVTTEEGHHIYIKDGEIVAGNPHVLKAIESARDRQSAATPTTADDPKTPPPPGKSYRPNVSSDSNGDGVTDAARVGVPAMQVPPLPPVGQLPNLTPEERAAETGFRDAYHADPDGVAARFLGMVQAVAAKKGEPPEFGTDDAKMLHTAWAHESLGLEERSQNRATLNCALHQTANAIAKRAFLQHLDTLKPGDDVMVTVGGCGCHVVDTPIMLADGSLKMVQDIKVGDELMGPDSRPRRVLRLIRGHGRLHRVIPKKGKPFTVNEDHVLSLQTKRVSGGAGRTRLCTVNLTVKDVLSRGESFVRNSWLYRVGVDFPTAHVALDPYFLGIWLGNGTHTLPLVTTPDQEIVDFLRGFSGRFPETELVRFTKNEGNLASDYKIALRDKHVGKGHPNPVTQMLRQLGVLGNKHIPQAYLKNDRQTRLRLLAGLLDTDGTIDGGNCFEFLSKDERLAYDVAYLARSLGLAAYVKPRLIKTEFIPEARTYWRVSISGDVDIIPTRVARKQGRRRVINKNVLRVGYALEPAGKGDYYGFTLEGDGLYLLDDFTVTHNSGKGWSLKNNPEVKAMKMGSKAVWDSAGDQNATENPWIQKECEARGLKTTYAYVHADPYKSWSNPEFGVVKRAGDPKDGRMVDSHVFADSYDKGAKNHQAFYEKNKDNPNASFVFLAAGKKLDGMPKEALGIDSDHLNDYARKTVRESGAPPHVVRGATVGERIWG